MPTTLRKRQGRDGLLPEIGAAVTIAAAAHALLGFNL
jgi:hypothetical protein